MPAWRIAGLLTGALLGMIAAGIVAVRAAGPPGAAGDAPRTELRLVRGDEPSAPDAGFDRSVLPSSPGAIRWRSRCRRWREMAMGLGETYAGYALRVGLAERHLPPIDGAGHRNPARWAWPWSRLAAGLGLPPPRLIKRSGDWVVRCADGTGHARCALIGKATPMPGMPSPGLLAPAITTHFVIDHVAGQEILLWRVVVPMPADRQIASAGHGLADAPLPEAVVPAARPDAAKPAMEIAVRSSPGTRRQWHRFTVCRAGGCVLEIGGARAGRIATGLAAGEAILLDLRFARGGDTPIEISASGFAAGLSELVRQRRMERELPKARP